jgi:hypothetical protein
LLRSDDAVQSREIESSAYSDGRFSKFEKESADSYRWRNSVSVFVNGLLPFL